MLEMNQVLLEDAGFVEADEVTQVPLVDFSCGCYCGDCSSPNLQNGQYQAGSFDAETARPL